jgi:hypothetical protein
MIILLLQFTNFFNDCPPFLADVDKKAKIILISPDGSGIPSCVLTGLIKRTAGQLLINIIKSMLLKINGAIFGLSGFIKSSPSVKGKTIIYNDQHEKNFNFNSSIFFFWLRWYAAACG